MLNLNFQNGQTPALNARNMNAIVGSINTLGYAVGGPNVASTVSEMTDTEKVYVYTGSETGYTAGNWYYYNGSAWVSGGVYQATAVETDTTLTMPGEPADAKAAGDAVDDLKNTIGEKVISDSNNLMVISPNILSFVRAGLSGGTGELTVATNRITTKDIQYCEHNIHITVASGFRIYFCTYDSNGTFLSGSGWINENSYYTLEKGTYYRLQIARMTDISEIADMKEFTQSCKMTYRTKDIADAIISSLGLIGINSFEYKVAANTVGGTQTIFKNIPLSRGNYYIECEQDVTLQTAGRNFFFYTNMGTSETIYEDPAAHLESGIHRWNFKITTAGIYSFYMLTNNTSADIINSNFRLGTILNANILTQKNSLIPSNPDDVKKDSVYYILNNQNTPEENGLLITSENGSAVNQTFVSNMNIIYTRRYTGSAWTNWMRQFGVCSYVNMNLGDGFGFLTETRHNEGNTLRLQQYFDWHNGLLRIRYFSNNEWHDWFTFRSIGGSTGYSGFLPCKKSLTFDAEYNATMGQGVAIYNNVMFAIYTRADGQGISVYDMTQTDEGGALRLITRDLNVEIGHGNAIQFGQILDGEYPHLYISGWDNNKVYEYKYESATGFTLIKNHSLPSNLAYTSVAVNELEKTFYIFNCAVYPEVLYNYDFIKWNYDTETIISQRKTEPFMTMQDCEFACGVIMVVGGYGQSTNPSTCYIYDTNGNRIGKVDLNTRLSTTEIEGITYDSITGELYIGQAYYLYRVRG